MKHFLVLLFLASTYLVFSQQETRNNLFWNNLSISNPAAVCLNHRFTVAALSRNQWTNINSAPISLSVTAAQRFDSIHSVIGLNYSYDEIGFNNENELKLNYAYRLELQESLLSFGISAGYNRTLVDPSWVGNFPDPLIPGKYIQNELQIDLGIVYQRNKLSFGLSATQLTCFQTSTSDDSFQNVPHYWLFADYTFQRNENWKFTPRLQLVTDLVKTAAMPVIQITWKDKLWFGGSFNNFSATGLFLGYDFYQKYRIGYSFELDQKYKLAQKPLPTHEIVFAFQLK